VLDQFIVANRDAIIASAKARVATRTGPKTSEAELTSGIPVFLEQLGDALRLSKSSEAVDHEQLGKTAARHGGDLFRLGRTIEQVVHDYGDVCQSISELAVQQEASISVPEFQMLNLCLDNAIAGAATEYSRQRERTFAHHGTEHVKNLAQELRELLDTAIATLEIVQTGRVAASGSTSLLLGNSLLRLRDLVDRSLAEAQPPTA
jgi:hypothetical protein